MIYSRIVMDIWLHVNICLLTSPDLSSLSGSEELCRLWRAPCSSKKKQKLILVKVMQMSHTNLQS